MAQRPKPTREQINLAQRRNRPNFHPNPHHLHHFHPALSAGLRSPSTNIPGPEYRSFRHQQYTALQQIFPNMDAHGLANPNANFEPTIFSSSGDRGGPHARIRAQHSADVAAALLLQQQQPGNRPHNNSIGSLNQGAQGGQANVATGDDRLNVQNRSNIGEQSGKSLLTAFQNGFHHFSLLQRWFSMLTTLQLAGANLNPQQQGNSSGLGANTQGGRGGQSRKYFLRLHGRSQSLKISRSYYHSSASHAQPR
jgi:hypothetical protein